MRILSFVLLLSCSPADNRIEELQKRVRELTDEVARVHACFERLAPEMSSEEMVIALRECNYRGPGR